MIFYIINKLSVPIIIITISQLILFCNNNDVKDTKVTSIYNFEEVFFKKDSIAFTDELAKQLDDFRSFGSYCENNDNLVFIEIKSNIILINKYGELTNRLGGHGHGPEELFGIFALGTYNEDGTCKIVIYDRGNDLIKIFTDDGELKETYKAPTSDGYWLEGYHIYKHNNKFYFSVSPIENELLIDKFDAEKPKYENEVFASYSSDFEKIGSHGLLPDYFYNENSFSIRPAISIDKHNNNLILIYDVLPIIQIYDIDNNYKLIDEFGIQTDNFKISDEVITPAMTMGKREEILKKPKSGYKAVSNRRLYIVFPWNSH